MKKNCLVAQSGGPTVAINASLAGVVDAVINSEKYDIIYGSVNGIQGVIKETLLNLTDIFTKTTATIEQLKTSPAMYLGSCRYKLPSITEDISQYELIFNVFKKLNIGAFFYIGGNDSMDTVDKLSSYAKDNNIDISIIGIPKTIDNDLCLTDHTPGYGSAAKFVATSLLEIAHDTYIYDTKSVTIVEIMGRDAGWLTAASALARNEYNIAPHLVYLPEVAFSTETFLEDVKELLKEHQNVIVAVSEGIRDKDGNYISAQSASLDKFGHAQLSGTGKYLENLVNDFIGCKVRSIELNVLQRSAMHCSSSTDLDESFLLGGEAVNLASKGLNKVMLTINRVKSNPYTTEIGYEDVSKIANMEKTIPLEWINKAGNDITQELIDYMRPLIEGQPDIEYRDGLPYYLPIQHLM